MEPINAKLVLKKDKKRGVYVFSEAEKHLYIGRTNNIRVRYDDHCNPGSVYGQASFALKLAREQTGKKASYKRDENSLRALSNNPEFQSAFEAAKDRIRKMEFRFVEESDPTRQALLEIYCSVVLETPYNNFDNH